MLERITVNLSGLVRHAKDAGRSYLVVPAVILTEGVHSGSNGPLFYPAQELSASTLAWNNAPVLVYHAMVNGQFDSAKHPEVVEKQQVGFLRNTRWRNGKLLTDCWIDSSRAQRIDNRILDSLAHGRSMEVSTGLFTENEEVSGEFRGKPYIAIARNYRPDHLALLPDQVGACSLAAGCGTLRLNQSTSQFTAPTKLKNLIDKILNSSNTQNIFCRTGKGGGQDPSCGKDGGGTGVNVDARESKAQLYEAQARSELLESKRQKIVSTIKKLLSLDKTHPKLAEMRQRLEAIIDDKLSADATVKQLTGNVGTAKAGFEANASKSLTMRSSIMNKAQVINNLIASEVWNESDRGWLESQPDGRLQLLAKGTCKAAEDALDNEEEEQGVTGGQSMKGKASSGIPFSANEEGQKSGGCLCANCEHASTCPGLVANHQQQAAATVQQYIAQAPAEFREILTNGLNAHLQEKAELVQTILTNSENAFTQKELEAYNLNTLKKLAKLASKPTGNEAANAQAIFVGQSGGQLTGNAGADDVPLLAPVMNFAEYRAKQSA